MKWRSLLSGPGVTTAYQLYKLLQFTSSLLVSILLVRLLGKGTDYYAWESLMVGVSPLIGMITYAQNNLFAQTWKPGLTLHAHWQMGTTLGAGAAGLLVVLALGTRLAPYDVVLPGCMLVFASIAGQDAENWLLKSGRHTLLVWLGGIYFLLLSLGTLLPLWLQFNLPMAVWGAAGVNMLRYIVYTTGVWRGWPPTPSTTSWLLFWPLVGVAIVSTGTLYLDKIIVRWLETPEGFQFFSVAARELPVTLILANALSLTLAGRIAEAGAAQPAILADMQQQSRKLMQLAFPVTWVLLLSSHWLFGRIYRAEFAPAAQVFNLYLLLVIPRMLFPQAILTGLRLNAVTFRISGIEAAIHVGLTLVLVTLVGYAGAAWATLIAYGAEKALLFRYARRHNLPAREGTDWSRWGLYSFITILCWIVSLQLG
ncbi:MAG: polysaccharide biosynthesis C-terminal domain-containing protein [Bacteroidetes bacterium]|nr:polysaccharide biosynthesis C-terminal domain-containing protein [Bacteroidota bacterium]